MNLAVCVKCFANLCEQKLFPLSYTMLFFVFFFWSVIYQNKLVSRDQFSPPCDLRQRARSVGASWNVLFCNRMFILRIKISANDIEIIDTLYSTYKKNDAWFDWHMRTRYFVINEKERLLRRRSSRNSLISQLQRSESNIRERDARDENK